jgi:hypothetical protein
MISNHARIRGVTNSVFVIIISVFTLTAAARLSFGIQQKDPDQKDIEKRISEIIRFTISEGETITSEGVRVSTVVPPSNEAVNEIKSFGVAAIPPLTRYLHDDGSREQVLAMRFLGAIGGHEIVQPLQDVLTASHSQLAKILALAWITQGPTNEVLPIVESFTNDSDPLIRKQAGESLIRLKER